MVLFPPLHSSKKDSYVYFSMVVIFRPSFSPSFASGEALPLRVLWSLCRPLTLRNHLALAARFACDACSVLASCSPRWLRL